MASERQLIARIEDLEDAIAELKRERAEAHSASERRMIDTKIEGKEGEIETAAESSPGLEERFIAALEKKYDITIERAEEPEEPETEEPESDRPRTPRTPKAKAPAKADDDTPEPEPKPDEDEPPEGTEHWSQRPMREVLGL